MTRPGLRRRGPGGLSMIMAKVVGGRRLRLRPLLFLLPLLVPSSSSLRHSSPRAVPPPSSTTTEAFAIVRPSSRSRSRSRSGGVIARRRQRRRLGPGDDDVPARPRIVVDGREMRMTHDDDGSERIRGTSDDDDGGDVFVDLLVIGGGMSGLAAAIVAADATTSTSTTTARGANASIMLLEASDGLGGRVRTDATADGYILDRGFAVFVEDYPTSRRLLDYDGLGLRRFDPGARVRLFERSSGAMVGGSFASVSDPLRRPEDALASLFSPICGPVDKLRLVPLFLTVLTKSVEGLFDMDETDARTCLRETYGFSEEFVNAFFAPFVEGIYLAPLEDVSSRMLHFVMKMFAGGSASLPRDGMGKVVDQLGERATNLGVDVRYESRAMSIVAVEVGGGGGGGGGDAGGGGYVVEVESRAAGKRAVRARCVVIATDVDAARGLLLGGEDANGLLGERRTEGSSPSRPEDEELPPRRSVGCVYYGFESPAPILDPVLILNGEGGRDASRRNTREYPINNVCFPSRVQGGYAPRGHELCSVSILENALDEHGRDVDSIDRSVRMQLATWFPEYARDIVDGSRWIRKGAYVIDEAQPANYRRDRGGVGCANVHGGRDCSAFRGASLPGGVFVCGDHMATATLNGALESGVNAGDAAARVLLSVRE